jgi:hypothetical protein
MIRTDCNRSQVVVAEFASNCLQRDLGFLLRLSV